METTWFILLWLVLATYVVLDGLDIGAGMLHLFIAKSEVERRQIIRSVGPVWDGNEVWLLVAGGTMFMAFPTLLATALSGFYLPVMMVLWLLIFRALGIELRHQVQDPLWTQAWDVAFGVASLLLGIFFGAALGNIVRGVPLQADGTFFEPLWTNFMLGENTGVLDWYTVLTAITAAAALAHHGALWLVARTDAAVQERARQTASRLWPVVLILSFILTAISFNVQPNVVESFKAHPWGLLLAAGAFAGLVGTKLCRQAGNARTAFRASALYLYGMIACAAMGIYPYALPGRDPELGLTVTEAASAPYGLKVALYWWIPGMLLACGYFIFLYSRMPATFSVHDSDEH